MSELRIGILESGDETLAAGDPRDAAAVQAAADAALEIERSCRKLGWKAIRVRAHPTSPDWTVAELAREEVDAVFQLVESLRGEARFEAAAAWLLEWAQIPYTGSGPMAITLSLEKPVARAVLRARGVPIPDGFVLESAKGSLPLPLAGRRWIVKPSHEDASHGIDAGSVVDGEDALRARAEHVLTTYRQPALVEEYVDGRELNVALLGSGDKVEVLPPGEIDFSRVPEGRPAILTYAAKWDVESEEYRSTPSVAAKRMPKELEERVHRVARAAYAGLGLAGYGRVDLRIHEERGPLVIDVNPNPDLSPDAGFAKAAQRASLTHADVVRRIVEDALRRAGALA